MKFAIAGAGAMGSRFVKMLYEADQDVVLIDNWKEHVDEIDKNGLKVLTDGKTHYYKIPAYLPESTPKQHFDCIILFTKAMQIDTMLSNIKHLIDEETYILVLANGIGNIETIEKYVDKARIVAGVTVWSSELNGPGFVTLTGKGTVSLQGIEIEPESEKFLNQLVDTMNQAQLNVSISKDVLEAIWKKAAFNSVLNTLTSIIGCNVGEFGRFTSRDFLIDGVLNEFEAIAQKMSIQFNKEATKELIVSQFSDDGNADHYTSMYQDLSKKRSTEIDYLNGYVAKKGKELGIATPFNELLSSLVHCREELF